MKIDRHHFLSELKRILLGFRDAQDLIDSREALRSRFEYYQERVKNPTNKRTGKPIKETTLKQYRSNLDSILKLRNEVTLLILICQEVGLLENPHGRRRKGKRHSFRRSSAKLQVIHGGGMSPKIEPLAPEIGPDWLYRAIFSED